MKTWTLLTAVAAVSALISTSVLAQTRAASTAQQVRADDRSSADIEQAQKALQEKGHDPGRIDGLIGPQTSAALRAYQKEQGLDETGRLDDATLARLGERATTPGSPETGGDARPSAMDPAQARKTGANAGEGASYNRSTEKGQSTMTGKDK